MTKKEKKLIDKGMQGSIRKQAELFNQSWITRYLYKVAVKKGQSAKY